MSKLLSLIVAAMFAAVSMTAIAQEKKPAKVEKSMEKKEAPKKEQTAAQKKRQERMKACNEQASERKLKGDERKKYMSSCLKPEPKKTSTTKMDTQKKDKK